MHSSISRWAAVDPTFIRCVFEESTGFCAEQAEPASKTEPSVHICQMVFIKQFCHRDVTDQAGVVNQSS
jgi:hypothetical protein